MRTSIKTLAVATLTIGTLIAAPAAFAADTTVTQGVTAGSLTASVSDVTLTPVAASHTATNGTGTIALAVNDLSGNGEGWNVTLEATAGFLYTAGGKGGTTIPATGFTVTPGSAISTGGQDETGVTPGGPGTLDGPVEIHSALAGNGMGSYTQDIGASLEVPGNSRTGTYEATLSTTVSNAP